MNDQTRGRDEDDAVPTEQFPESSEASRPVGGDGVGAARSLRKHRIWVGVGIVAVIAAATVGGYLWGRGGQQQSGDKSATFSAKKVSAVVSKFPEGTQVIKGEKTMGSEELTGLAASGDNGVVTPTNCQGKQKTDTRRMLGTTASTVNAEIKGVNYVVTAQEIPSSNGPRVKRDAACARMSVSNPDGSYYIVSPADAPKIGEVDVEGTRTVTRTSIKETVDSFVFIAWIDDYHAVVVQAVSDPTYKPQANPIDPTFAKELLSEAVRLVTTT